MNTFTASNGISVVLYEDGSVCVGEDPVGIEEAKALREFFRAERDEELGRWRYPEDHEWIVYPDGEDQLGNRHVITFWEKNGRRDSIYEDAIPRTLWGIVARAYFEAHPEPKKPWEDAKHEEVWLLTVNGDTGPFLADQDSDSPVAAFVAANGTRIARYDREQITAGRRIYPEASDVD